MSKIDTSVRAAVLEFQTAPFHTITLIGAVVAAATTFATLAVELAAWAMFLSWVAFNTSGQTLRDNIANFAAFTVGIAFGVGTGLMISALTPSLGAFATPLAVFADVVLVLSLRALPRINNPLAYFLGLTSFFASGQPPSASTFAMLAAAGVLGAVGAGLANHLQARLVRTA